VSAKIAQRLSAGFVTHFARRFASERQDNSFVLTDLVFGVIINPSVKTLGYFQNPSAILLYHQPQR
jgi:hypothetical protein